jgi:2-C-methyl-D-erythritol 4-phosphate cytidylyltransferase
VTAIAVIVAAGKGERLGLPDKVLLPIAGEPALLRSVKAALAAESISSAVVVAGSHTMDAIKALLDAHELPKPVSVVVGGARRQDSVLIGVRLARVLGGDVVAVHDGARPLARPQLFDETIATARVWGGAIAAVPIADSLKRVEFDRVVTSVSRDHLWAAQTPQSFQTDKLLAAFDVAEQRGINVTDEAGLFEELGWSVHVVMGSAENLKLTRAADIPLLEALVSAHEATLEIGQE